METGKARISCILNEILQRCSGALVVVRARARART